MGSAAVLRAYGWRANGAVTSVGAPVAAKVVFPTALLTHAGNPCSCKYLGAVNRCLVTRPPPSTSSFTVIVACRSVPVAARNTQSSILLRRSPSLISLLVRVLASSPFDVKSSFAGGRLKSAPTVCDARSAPLSITGPVSSGGSDSSASRLFVAGPSGPNVRGDLRLRPFDLAGACAGSATAGRASMLLGDALCCHGRARPMYIAAPPSSVPTMKAMMTRTIQLYHGTVSPWAATAVSLFAFAVFVVAGAVGQGWFPHSAGGLPSLAFAEIAVCLFIVTMAFGAGAVQQNLQWRWPAQRYILAAILIGCSMWYSNLLLTLWLHAQIALPTDNAAVSAAVHRPSLPLSMIVVGVLPGICEEMWFRGWWLRGLANRLSPFVAIFCTSVAFAGFHLSWAQTPSTLLLGLALGWLTLQSHSVIPAMMAHICNNLIAVVMSRVTSVANTWISEHPQSCLVITLSMTAAGIWCGCARHGAPFDSTARSIQ
jgi:membrane protease YdiL (CAAX protease family)